MSEVIKNIKKRKEFKDLDITSGDDHHLRIEKIPFDIFLLDRLLCGGLPIGRINLMYGTFSVGKTFLCQKLIASAQKKGLSTVLIDIDRTFAPDWWEQVGVKLSDLPVARPTHGEQAFDLAVSLAEEGVDVIIMDGIDMLMPTSEAEAGMDESFIGSQARLVASGLRKLVRVNSKSLILLTNHVREGIGKFSQWRIPGGKAQEDFSSVMLWIARGSSIKEADIKKGGDDKKKAGFKMRVTLEKDKVDGNMYEHCELPFLFEGGVIDSVSALIELAIDAGIIKQAGPWYEFMGQRIMGKLEVKKFLLDNEDVQSDIKKQVTGEGNG